MSSPRLPSGAQHEIRHGAQRAVLVEVGGGLRSYEVDGEPVLDGYTAQERCSGGRGQVLMPWPNRLQDGRYEFDGETQQLPINELETQTAIHGLVRWASWQVQEHSESALTLTLALFPQPGWPGALDLRIRYELSDEGLTVSAVAGNAGLAACPFGAGFHPYLALGVHAVDELELQVPARSYLQADERGLPVALREVAGTEFDFRRPRRIGAARLDTCFTQLERDGNGVARVRLTAPSGPASLWVDRAFGYLMVFTGDTLPADRRRRGLAVEPMSCPPNALRTGEAARRLEPGERFTGRWGISLRT